jgi:hypothetical protein
MVGVEWIIEGNTASNNQCREVRSVMIRADSVTINDNYGHSGFQQWRWRWNGCFRIARTKRIWCGTLSGRWHEGSPTMTKLANFKRAPLTQSLTICPGTFGFYQWAALDDDYSCQRRLLCHGSMYSSGQRYGPIIPYANFFYACHEEIAPLAVMRVRQSKNQRKGCTVLDDAAADTFWISTSQSICDSTGTSGGTQSLWI